MTQTSQPAPKCSILRSLNVIGDHWTLGALRCVFLGVRRFEAMQRELGVATNVLSGRLRGLVDNGILVRVPYQERPRRHEYQLTPKGAELGSIILTLKVWGDRYLQPAGPFSEARHAACGSAIDVVAHCPSCATPVPVDTVLFVPTARSPAAS